MQAASRPCFYDDDLVRFIGDLVSLWSLSSQQLVLGAGVKQYKVVQTIKNLHKLVQDQTGVTAIEYALMASGIAVAIVLVVISIGSGLQLIFTDVETGLATGS
jgi:pilus assembly protein Flp/PilA